MTPASINPDTLTPATPATAAPRAAATEELALLTQITRRVAKISTGGKIWLRDRLTTEIDEEL